MVWWSAQFDEVAFALEDCRHLTRRLKADLLAAGCRVVRVSTKLMAGARRVAREPDKSDPIDAEAVALAALRHPDLPVAELDEPPREVKLLPDHRHDLVVQRTRLAAQIRWYLHELDPDLEIPSRGFRRHCVVAEVAVEIDRFSGVVARLTRDLLTRCDELNHQINALEAELRHLTLAIAPALLAILGCGVLTAAVIIGETAGVHRSRDKGRLRSFHRNGTGLGVVGASAGKVRPRRQPDDELCPCK